MALGQELKVGLVAHKSFRVGDEVLRLCRSSRQAYVISRGSDDSPDNFVLYTYMGGGVEYQPENTYALVYKYLPLGVARRLYALWMLTLRSEVDEHVMVRKQNRKVTD